MKAFLASIPGQNFETAAETCFENCVDGKTLAALTQAQLESLLHLDADEALILTEKLKESSMQPATTGRGLNSLHLHGRGQLHPTRDQEQGGMHKIQAGAGCSRGTVCAADPVEEEGSA